MNKEWFERFSRRPTAEQFLNLEFFQRYIAPRMDERRRTLLGYVSQGYKIKGLVHKEEMFLTRKSLSEMRLCWFWEDAKDLIPKGFRLVIEGGAIALDGTVMNTSSIEKCEHVYLEEKQGDKVICPVFGQFFWYKEDYPPGGVIEKLYSIAPELVYPVGEGCGVLYGERDEIIEQLGLAFLTNVYLDDQID